MRESGALAVTPPARVSPPTRPQTPAETDFAGLLRLCEALLATHFLPRAVDTAGKAAALVLTGREMGLGPMASIRSLAIVDGKPVLAADLQLGIFKRAGGQAVFQRLDEQGAVLWLRHMNGDEHVETFTAEDAQRAGLAGKDNWKRYPKAMYRSRAITAGLKSLGFEPLAGTYDPEELEPGAAAARPEPMGGNGPAAPALAAPKDVAEPSGNGEPVTLDTPVPFGAHKGKTVKDAGYPYFNRLLERAGTEDRETPWAKFAAAAMVAFEDAPAGAAEDEPPL